MDEEIERQAIASGRGKWGRAGVPHRGWECVRWYDNKDRYDGQGRSGPEEDVRLHPTFELAGNEGETICQMCESTEIRYVHVMQHPDYREGDLHCGCICAGHMSGNLAAARSRERSMRNRATRRGRFPRRKGWKVSAKGNSHIKVDGYHVVLVRRGGGFGIGLTPPGAEDMMWGRKTYPTEHAARLGAFDAIEIVRERGS
jgi:hypothetical protein